MMYRAIFAIALGAVLGGCSGESGPDCGAVGNVAVEFIRAEIRAEPDAEAQKAMESMLGPLKDGIVSRCRDDDWDQDDRRCFVEAESLQGADTCVQRASPGADAPDLAPPARQDAAPEE